MERGEESVWGEERRNERERVDGRTELTKSTDNHYFTPRASWIGGSL